MSSINTTTINGALAANRATFTIKAGGSSSSVNVTPVARPITMDGTSANNFEQMASSANATGVGLNFAIGSTIGTVDSFTKDIDIRVANEYVHKISFDGLHQKLSDVEVNTTGLIQSRVGKYYNGAGTLVTIPSSLTVTYGASDRAASNGRQASGLYYYRNGKTSVTKGIAKPTT